MNIFHSILAEIKKNIDAKHIHTETVAKIISEKIKYVIDPALITQRASHISIKVSPTIKMQITIKRREILEALQREGFKITSIS